MCVNKLIYVQFRFVIRLGTVLPFSSYKRYSKYGSEIMKVTDEGGAKKATER